MQPHNQSPNLIQNFPGASAQPKKARKPYIITKMREAWTPLEHEAFVAALERHGRDWRVIEAEVKTKSVVQIRSHAQKYFLKMQKNGLAQHVPPPRSKKKRRVCRPNTNTTPPIPIPTPSSSGGRPNFARIYAVFARVVDPNTPSCSMNNTNLTSLEKEIVKMLIGNLELNIADKKAVSACFAAHERQVTSAFSSQNHNNNHNHSASQSHNHSSPHRR